MSKFNVVSKYVAAVPRSQRRKGAGVSSAPSSGVAGSGIDKNTLSQFVDLFSPQTVEGLKNYLNGLQIGGKLVKYDAVTNAFVFPANAVFEGGVAWNTKLEGFEEQTVTAAVRVDWKTIGKNENGELYVIGGTSGGGGGVVGGVTLDEVKNYLTAEKYTTETWVSAQNYATQSWVTNKGYITGITSSMVTSALGYTPFDAANFTKSKIKSTLGISDWALASVKPSYKFAEISEKPTTLGGYGITDAYTKNEVSDAITEAFNDFASKVSNDGVVNTYKELIDYAATHGADFTTLVGVVNGKADKATTLAGYGITDAYTKTQVDSALVKKWTQDDSLIANWNSAYLWGNHALAGYAKQGDVTSELGKYVTLATAQTVTGIKNFVNGLKIGGALVTYNASKNAFIFPANAIFEGGIAWNSSIDGFEPQDILDAIPVDEATISKANGYLEFIGKTSGGGVADSIAWGNVTGRPTKLSDFTDDVVSGKYLSILGGSVNGSITATKFIGDLDGIANSATYISYREYSGDLNNAPDDRFFWSGFQPSNRPAENYATGVTLHNGALGYSYQLAFVTSGGLYARYKSSAWSEWRELLDSNNYTKYTLSLSTGGVVSQDGYWSVKFKSTGQDGSLVGFETKFGHSAWFGYGGGDTWIVTNRGWNEVYTLLHSDNYSDYALPKDGIAVAANVLKSSATANTWTVGKGNGIDCYNSYATQRYWFGFAMPEGSPYATTKWVFGASDSSGRADGETYAKHLSLGYGTDIATGGYTLRVNGDAKIDGALRLNANLTMAGNIRPAANFSYQVGTSDARFAYVYSTFGDFSADVSAESVTINGGLISYDANLKAFILNGNLIVKGGIAWEKQNS